MDAFLEFLVKKKSRSDDVKRAGLTILCIIVCLVFVLVSLSNRSLFSIMPILVAGAIYGTVILRRNFNIEYEYIFTNGILDIDVIKGRARREKLISVPCKSIEHMGAVTTIRSTQNRVVNAMYDESRPGKFCITFSDGGQKTELYFQPPEKLLLAMKKYNPRNIDIS